MFLVSPDLLPEALVHATRAIQQHALTLLGCEPFLHELHEFVEENLFKILSAGRYLPTPHSLEQEHKKKKELEAAARAKQKAADDDEPSAKGKSKPVRAARPDREQAKALAEEKRLERLYREREKRVSALGVCMRVRICM